MKKGIPRKVKHELKNPKGRFVQRDKSMKGFHRRMTISNEKRASQEKRSMSWKPKRAVRAKINQWRVSTEEWQFQLGQSCNQKDIPENSKTFTNGSLWKSSWDQFDKRAQVFICLDILFPLSSFLIFTLTLHVWALFFFF